LIECQGQYFHNKKDTISRDKAKATYVSSTFPDQYELKTIWEHEFSCQSRIIDLIKYWLGAITDIINFSFNDIVVKKCESDEYKILLGKYHYLAGIGRNSIPYGAYFNNELVGCIAYSPISRQNISIDGFNQNEIRELSRLCIHPKYQKKNFASWLIAQSLKLLDNKYKCIISYSDETFNHTGIIYKASNFINDSIVPVDYWYVDSNGWKMHKRTLYGKAIQNSVTERQFAETNGYTKVYGKEKKRWVYKR